MEIRNILILGANSFIGKNLTPVLSKQQGVKITAISRQNLSSLSSDNVRYVQVKSIAALSNYKFLFDDIDCVIHLVSTSLPSSNSFILEIKDNLAPSVELLDIMVEKKIKKLIYLSSGGAIYGNTLDDLLNEKDTTNPLSIYGLGKLFFEKCINYYETNFGLEAVVLRPSNIYGPNFNNEGKQGFINTMLFNFINNKDIEIWGNGSTVRDYLYIDDFTNLICKIVNDFLPGLYNVGSGKGYAVNEIIEIASEVINQKIPVIYVGSQKNAPNTAILDTVKVKERFNFLCNIDLQSGIEKTWAYYKNIKV